MEKLIDSYGRQIVYLRISLTDRCNFRCIYCSPSECKFRFIEHEQILRFEEILEIANAAVEMGITKIRLTGGEPLVRKGVVGFIRQLRQIGGLEDISMTTNGFFLSEMAQSLKSSGLDRVNISLDSLVREKFRAITGLDELPRVLEGIDAAFREGLTPVKINVVLLKGINDDEVESFIKLTIARPLNVRFIELMPTNQVLKEITADHFISLQKIQEKIQGKFPDISPASVEKGCGPASYYQLKGAKGIFGFITAVSQHFCARCNRVRLTAEGNLRPCLYSFKELELKKELRKIPLNEHKLRNKLIKSFLKEAVKAKPLRHGLTEKNSAEFDMSKIGG
ncbi:MAG TPA: GTP 3',8-cyclase MoaA [Atribacterota bacterium]|nr:GTP 3',8-cyclase MoaA [Atribacterota bacterium]